jgi:hypothetical protein
VVGVRKGAGGARPRDGLFTVTNVLACLRQDGSGCSLPEYSFLITLMIVLVVVGVALAGHWAANVWANLLPTLPP